MKNNSTTRNSFFMQKTGFVQLYNEHSFSYLRSFLVLFFVFISGSGFGQGTDCASATTVAVNGTCFTGSSNNIVDAVSSGPVLSTCTGSGSFQREGWFTFTISGGTVNVTIIAQSQNRNLFLQLISQTSTCSGLAQIACANDDAGGNSAQTETINANLANGVYYVKVVNISGNQNMQLNSLCITSTPTITYTASGTFTVPSGVNCISVETWGAGGRGAQMGSTGRGGGGGGGAYSRSNISVSSGTSYNVYVGTGSTSATAGGDSGFSTSTLVASTVLAKGGNSAANNSTNGALGGLASSGVGNVRYDGGDGANSGASYTGGGGSSAGESVEGNDASGITGGSAPTGGGAGANGHDSGNTAGNAGSIPGGGGSGARRSSSGTPAGGAGANGRVRITYYTNPTAPTTITPSANPICIGETTTLTASGGSTGSGASMLWFAGGCAGVGYAQEWKAQPFLLNHTTLNSVTTEGINVTSTGIDPMIHMYGIGSFNPVTYKNIAVRYKVIAGTGGVMEVFFTNTAHTEAHASQSVGVAVISDNQWHVASFDMAAHANWDDSNVTGWRLDYASNSGVQMEIDYVVLTTLPVLESSATNESIAVVAPTANTTYYAMRMAESACAEVTSCASRAITANTVDTIVSTTGARRCGNGTVILHALGTVGTTHYRWYLLSSGGSPTGTTTTPYWTTPSLSTNTTYYVAAYNGNCESPRVAVTATIDSASTITAPTTITGNTIVCPGDSTTLTASGGTLGTGASTLWFSGSCADIGFGQEWQTQPYGSGGTTVNSSGSVLNVTSTNVDPQINMFNVGVFNPNVYRYIIIRYQVVSGSAGNAEIYYENVTNSGLSESKVVRNSLISDASWHVLSLDMATSANWTTNTITGWRFDWCSQNGVTMNIDYIALSSMPALENTNSNDASIAVSPVGDITYYALRMAELSCFATTTCANVLVYGGKTWTGAVDNNWTTAGNWSPSGMPTSNHCVESAAGTVTVNGNGNAHSVTLTGSSGLTILSNNTLTVQNEINTSGSTGVFLIQDSGSVLQNTGATNTGNITAIRNARPMKRYDFTYWSSPVAGQTLHNLSPTTLFDKYFSWNPAGSWIPHNYGAATMQTGKGYIVRAPQSFPINTTDNFIGNFIGTPNNGEITISDFQGSSTTQVWNLVGNPYPSALDIKLFLADLDNSEVGGTVYLWTHNTPPGQGGGGEYAYTSNDYASYNLSGFVATALAATSGIDPEDNINVLTNGYIASGQAFFIRGIVNGTNTIKFKNGMRVASSNGNFFKPAPTTPVENWETTGKHRFWLNLRNEQGAFNQALVGYIEDATDGLDRLYDGELFGGNYVTLYSLLDQTKLTIQGKALPFNDEDVVPLGYKVTIAGTFNISLDHFDGLFEAQDVFLKDNLLNVVHNLKDGPYSFTSTIGTFDSRFSIIYQNETLGTENPEINPESIVVYKSINSTITVNAGTYLIDKVKIYDIAGRLLSQTGSVNNSETVIKNLPDTQQVLIVDVLTVEGHKVAKKIVF